MHITFDNLKTSSSIPTTFSRYIAGYSVSWTHPVSSHPTTVVRTASCLQYDDYSFIKYYQILYYFCYNPQCHSTQIIFTGTETV